MSGWDEEEEERRRGAAGQTAYQMRRKNEWEAGTRLSHHSRSHLRLPQLLRGGLAMKSTN